VYDLTVTAAEGTRLAPGLFEARGVLSLGAQTARTHRGAPLDVLRRGQ
jgi:hypothetical protein